MRVLLWLANGEPGLRAQANSRGFDATVYGPEPFQLFRRFPNHTEGTDVGLYLVNRLVQANAGHIEVDSNVGVGATFWVYLGQPSPPQLPV